MSDGNRALSGPRVIEDYIPEFCDGCDTELDYDARTCENCEGQYCWSCFGSVCDDLYAGWCVGCAG